MFNDSGPITIASNELDLGGATSLNSGASITGPSSTTLGVEYGSVTLNSGASISGPGTIDGNGTLVLNTNLTALAVHVSTVSGPGNLTVTSDLDVSNLEGPGTVTATSAATFESSSLNVDGGTLVNEGSGTAEPSSGMYVAAGATFTNQGSLTLDSSSYVYGGCANGSTPAGVMNSTGSITSTATSGFPASIGYPYNNYCLVFNDSGPITIASNELDLGGATSLNSGASITGPSSTTLGVEYGSVTLNSGASISGPGTIDGNGTLVLNTNLTALAVHVSTVSGPGNLTVTSDLDVSNLEGPGTVTATSAATFESSSLNVDGGTLVNEGSGTAEANSGMYVAAGATFTNQGSLTLDSSSYVYGGCANGSTPAGVMNNTGSITSKPIQGYSASLGSSNCMTLNDTGPITIASDELDLGGATSLNSGASITGSSSTTLDITGTVAVNPGATLNGTANIDDDGTIIANAAMSVPDLSITGTLEIAPGKQVRATSVPSLIGTIELEGTGGFGQLVVAGAVGVSSAELDFPNPSFSPDCGAGITAITTGSDSGTFAGISGANLPSGGSWNATSTATTAGAFVYCPPPPQSQPAGGPVPSGAVYGGGSASMPDDCSCGAGEPVNLSTGNFYETDTDIDVIGRGPNLNVTRTYNSLGAATTGPFGYGWSSTLGVNLVESDSNTVATITDEQGSQVVFTLDSGSWTAPPRNASTLTQTGSMWSYSRWDGATFAFNSTGQLTSQSDRNGNTMTFAYNGQGQLATVSDASGRELKITWTGTHITSIADPDNQTVTYTYDPAGDLTDVENLNGGTTSFSYASAHLVSTVTDPDDNVLTNTYNSADQVTKQVDALNRVTTFSYSVPGADGTTTLVTDPNGNETLYTFEYGVMVEMTAAYDTPLAATTLYIHDPTTLGVISETDPDGNNTTSAYDDNGNVLTTTTSLGEETVNTYNSFNELLTATNPSGVETTDTYDADGNLLTKSTPLLNSSGGTVATATTAYTYGDATNPGLPTKVEDPNGNTATYTYDTHGDNISVTNSVGDKTTLTYDILGRRLTEVAPDGNVSGCGCASSYTTTYTYNPLNEVLTVIDPRGNKTVNNYNGDGKQLTSQQPSSTLTTTTFDADNEATQVEVTNGSTVQQQTKTSYDGGGNVVSQTNGDGQVTSYTYNALSQQISVTNPLSQTTTSTYDSDGNPLTVTQPNGTTTTNTYNADRELVQTTYSDGTHSIQYTYDPETRKVGMTDSTGTSAWTYDSLGRLKSYLQGNGDQVSYAYDLDGNETSITYPSGSTVSRHFNAADQMQSLTDLNTQSTTFGYDASGNITQEALPNGVTNNYTYDANSNLTSITDKDGSSTVFAANYTLDNEDLIIEDTSQPTSSSAYQYNSLNEICYAAASNSNPCSTAPSGSESFAYDGAGNLTVDDGITQSYNGDSELCWSVTGTPSDSCSMTPAGATTYSYSSQGNLTTETASSGGVTTLSYNGANEMTQYQIGTGTPTTYTYDGDGLRMSKSGGVSTSYAWDPTSTVPLLLQETTGSATTEYVYGPGGLPLEEVQSSGKTFYYAHDNLGSTRALTKSTGAVADTDTYSPYGALTTSTGTIQDNLLYAGQYLDAESGFYYLRARYYDPPIGQFTTVDPLVGDTGQPYEYADDDAINSSDPSGMCSWYNLYCDVNVDVVQPVDRFLNSFCLGRTLLAALSGYFLSNQSSDQPTTSEGPSDNSGYSNSNSSNTNWSPVNSQCAETVGNDPTNPLTIDQCYTQNGSPTCQLLGSDCGVAQNYTSGLSKAWDWAKDFL